MWPRQLSFWRAMKPATSPGTRSTSTAGCIWLDRAFRMLARRLVKLTLQGALTKMNRVFWQAHSYSTSYGGWGARGASQERTRGEKERQPGKAAQKNFTRATTGWG